jgi:hypothetical protein
LDAAKLGVLHSQATNQFERARAHQFESGFADSWFPELMKRVVCRPEEQDHVACIWLQYHMRVFTCGGSPKIYTYAEEGVELVRAQGDLFSPISGKVMHIVERRFSFALKTTTAVDLPIFTLINLSDYVLPDSGIKSLARNQVHNSEEWKSLNIRPWIRGTGIAAFAFRIHSWCGIWARLWSKLLDEIDGVSGIEVSPNSVPSHQPIYWACHTAPPATRL